MALTHFVSAGCGLWEQGSWDSLVSVWTRASGAAGVQTHTMGPPKGGHYVRSEASGPPRGADTMYGRPCSVRGDA